MSKKLYNLIFGVITGAETIGEAVVVYTAPAYAVQIAAAIPIAGNAIVAICKLFVKDDE